MDCASVRFGKLNAGQRDLVILNLFFALFLLSSCDQPSFSMSLFLGDPMRICIFSSCLLFCLTHSYSAQSQTSTPSSFQTQAQMATSAKTFSVVNVTANAEWTTGSTHEAGTAQLQAKVDGSASLQLSIGPASRMESQTKADNSRTCAWTDAVGTSHKIHGPNCFIAVPWFAPGLFTQPLSLLPAQLGTIDVGEVSNSGTTLHQINYFLNLADAANSSMSQANDLSTVKVFYDPQTHLPVSLEYLIHPDNDDAKNVDVRVLFSNYQSTSGVMLPFHIEKYVNRSLQLKLDISNATIQ
jgi:hypothetical protein